MERFTKLKAFCDEIGCVCLEHEPMAVHTSFRIGGPVRLFLRPRDEREASQVIHQASSLQIPLVYVGKGSNLLVSDDALELAVLCLREDHVQPVLTQMPEEPSKALITCFAGMGLRALCTFALHHRLTGLEFAYGIPGSVGGAVYMNAGAYGGEMREIVRSVEYLDAQGELHTIDTTELNFSYRHSWFCEHPDCLITAVTICLSTGEPQAIHAKMEELMGRRVSKQPLDYPSAGSTFKRPQGAYASALIDQCGLKGLRVGGAMVSEKHAGFLINYDHATCADVQQLIQQVQQRVQQQTGFSLECEVRRLGIG
ncbi:MAG: UDP-N-acetylmuramate dehydrogenase [Anaerotruncus sp.]|nr:UDP-N-acetylmuramate dehydrogenase [Anaerotruncus sp.]